MEALMYILLFVSVLAAALNSTVLHTAGLKSKKEIFKFNFLCSLVWIAVLFAACGFKINLNGEVLLWGIVYGAVQAMFVLFKTVAMGLGPVSITTLIGNCLLLISISVSVILWNERVSVVQVLGVAILLVSVFLCTYAKSSEKMSGRWKLSCVVFFVFAAAVGVVFKAFSKSGLADYTGDMMFTAAVVMAVCYLGMCVFTGAFDAVRKPVDKRFVWIALISGLLSCVYNRLNINLSAAIDAVIFFPGFNGGVIVLSSILGIVLLKEKITKRQIIGLVMGTAAILIVGIF